MFRFAHFFTFPYNMIVDSKSLNKPLIFEYNGFKLRFNSPYKSYLYNHDFSFKPKYYVNSIGKRELLPIAKSIRSYPMYDKNLNHIGMFIQQNEKFSFEEAQLMKLTEEELPEINYDFKPVDTIRFDSVKHFNLDSPKFISSFVAHLRNISGQFWLGKPRTDSEGVSIEGNIKSNGSIDNFQFHSNLIPIIRYNKGIPIDYAIWSESIKNTIEGTDIDFARSLYLDALYENLSNNSREVVLNIANSLDITINKLFKKIHEKNDNQEIFDRKYFVERHRKNKKIASTYLPGLVAEFLCDLLNVNYKTENPINYEIIKVFWLEKRNTVAHGGNIKFEEIEIHNLFDAVEHLTNWISKINIDK
jgi:hypothetical protein